MKKIYIEKELLQNVYEELKSQKEVAKYFQVSLKVIKRLVKEYNLGTYEHFAYIPPKEELQSIFEQGGCKKDICLKYNVKNNTVGKWLQHYGISAVRSDYKHLTETQYAVTIGSILGDGSLEGRVLAISHSIKQEQYLDYKMHFFKDEISPKDYRTTKEGYKSVRCRTKAFGDIKNLHKLFYKGRIKAIPETIKGMLSPLAIAIWYMDDGTKKAEHYGNIATCCFTLDECTILSNALNEIIGISTYVVLDRGYYLIKIPAKDKSFVKFCKYIKEFVPDSMKYKLSEEV